MGTTTGTDYVTITANNNGATKTASTNVTNAVTNSDYNSSNSDYVVDTVTIGSGLNAGASEATVSVTGHHTHTYYYYYTSGSTSGPYTSTPSDTPTWSVTSQYINSSGNTITRFSKDGSKLKHATMGSTTGTDYVTITANNNGGTKTASTNVTNAVTNSDYNSSNSDYTVNVSIGSGLNAGASSATVSVSGSHTHTYYYLYTSGSTSGPYTSTPSDSPSWSITSQYLNSSSNTITRFSKSSNTLSHATMCETLGTDYVTITATNNTATKTASTNVTNTRWDTNLSSYWASISITNKSGITCAGGSSSVSASAGHSAKYTYTSGCVSSDTHSVSDGVTWSITSNGNSRFSKSGNTLSHSSMTTNVTTDTVVVTAVNDNSSSATATDTTSASNTITNSNYNPSGYWSSVSIGNGMTCSGGSATVTASAGHIAYNYYCSGSADSNTHSVSDSVTWSITSNGNSRFTKSGNTLSHDNMTTNGVTDTVTVTAVNGSSSSATSTDTKSISNPITDTNYSPSDYTASVSIGSGLTAGGGSATVTASASHQAYDLYCSGSYNNKHTVTDSVSWSITGNGNSRFEKSGNKVTHSSMGCTATTDTVTVTAVNGSSSSATATDSKSITNAITNSNYSPSDYVASISINNKSGLTAAGGSSTVTASASHKAYDLYTSGSACNQHTVTDSVSWTITSNGGSRFTKSDNTLSHSSMGCTATTDTVEVTAVNGSSSSATATDTASIVNSRESTNYSPSDYTVSVSIGDGLICSGGSAKVTASASHLAYDHYTSGSSCNQHTVTDTAKWRITSNGNSRFSHPSSGGSTINVGGTNVTVYDSGTSVSHSNMTTNNPSGGDVVTVTAYNTTSTSASATASKTITNPITSTNYSPSNYTVSVSIGDGMTAAGGSATVTASASHKAYDLYCSGSYNNQHTVTDSVSWDITGNGNNRFEKSGNKVNHSSMGCNATTDTVTVTATNGSNTTTTTTATKSIANAITNSNYSPSDYTVSVSIGSGLTPGSSSATVTASASHKAYDLYTSGSACNQHTVTDGVTWSITSQTFTPSGGSASAITRFSKSDNTLSHSSMNANVGVDKATITAVNSSNSSTTATATTSNLTNSKDNTNYSPSNYTASVSLSPDNLTAGGGSATVVASASHLAYDYYTSGYSNNQHTVSDGVSWSITSQTFTPSGGSASTITRFSKSSNTLSHTSMGTNVGTDYVKVTATNSSSSTGTAFVEKSISNAITNTNYSPSDYVASISIGSGLTAAGGEATVTASASHQAYDYYTSGSTANKHTVTDSVSWSITGNGNSRFEKSGNKVTHSSMGCTATTDTVTVTAVNGSSSSATATDSKSIVNEITNSNYSPSNYTASISINNKSGLTAAGGSSTVTASASHLAYNYYTSGSYCGQHTVTDGVTWSITSNGGSRFTKSDNTLSHSSMGCTATTDTVEVTAVNGSSSSATATDTASIVNAITNSNYAPSDYTVSVSIGSGLTAAGGSAIVTASASHKAYNYYTSGSYCGQHTVTDTAKWRITSNGNSRFSHPSSGGSTINVGGTNVTVYDSGTSVSHSNMTTNIATDTVTVTAYNISNTATYSTASKSISNAVESISLTINGESESTSVNFGSSISESNIVVTGTYTSGRTGQISATILSSDTTVATIS